MKRKAAFIIILILLLLFYFLKINYTSRGFIGGIINKYDGKTLNKNFSIKIKSGNLCTDYKIKTVLEDVHKFNLNTLNVPVVIEIKDINSSSMKINNDSIYKAKELLKELKGKKINIILEPYPWIKGGSVGETEWIPDNIDNFFSNWKHIVLKPIIDEIAVPYNVDALNIGTSFVHMEFREDDMCKIIDFVRKYYKGLVTYRTNFWTTAVWDSELNKEYEKKLNNKLFSKLDFISIAAYFELTDNETNSVDNLVKALESTERNNRRQNVKKEIKNFYTKWHKPVFFGELGFPRTNMSSIMPWNSNTAREISNMDEKKYDKEQARCFKAYEESFSREAWNLGFSIFAIGNKNSDKKYYPSIESTDIIEKWYKGS